MSVVFAVVGLLAGALGALGHLGVTWLRARAVTRGSTAASWALMPLGFGAIALALWAAAMLAPLAAWSAVLGLFLARALMLARMRRGP